MLAPSRRSARPPRTERRAGVPSAHAPPESNMMLAAAVALAIALLAAAPAARGADYVEVPAGTLTSAIAGDADRTPVPVGPFALRVAPVTRGEFLRFVEAHPEWRRDRVAATFADAGYLHAWRTPLALAASDDEQ